MMSKVGIFIIITGLIFKLFPPKKINYLYGHRTRFAMTNQDIWQMAQRKSAIGLILLGVVIVALNLILKTLSTDVTENIEGMIFIVGIVIHVLVIETILKRSFNKDGSRKN